MKQKEFIDTVVRSAHTNSRELTLTEISYINPQGVLYTGARIEMPPVQYNSSQKDGIIRVTAYTKDGQSIGYVAYTIDNIWDSIRVDFDLETEQILKVIRKPTRSRPSQVKFQLSGLNMNDALEALVQAIFKARYDI